MDPSTICVSHGRHDEDDVVPPITVSSTYRANEDLTNQKVYARMEGSHAARDRAEEVLAALEGSGAKALLYSSGQAAMFAVLNRTKLDGARRVSFLGPHGYHGTPQIAEILGLEKIIPTACVDFEQALLPLDDNDVLWVETPNNPKCEVFDVEAAVKARDASGKKVKVCVDGTFAPPPVQRLLRCGADFVVHSTTKFLNGHSDALGGVVLFDASTAAGQDTAKKLSFERTVMGNVPGSLDAWLLLRSLKTLAVRLDRQCATALRLAAYLHENRASLGVTVVHHPSLPHCHGHDAVAKQMTSAGSLLAFELEDADAARVLHNHLSIIVGATSLGSVESLIEWRRRWDSKVPAGLLRLSVGLEAFEDLKADLLAGFEKAKAAAAAAKK
ncbi:Cystathionine beta-lyase [Diplonema papillatum]|nr:Cystathionine beta-lyase [Diplonema papillatum]|eukprot:gene15071-23011_t